MSNPEDLKVVDPSDETGPADSAESGEGLVFSLAYQDKPVDRMLQDNLSLDRIQRVVIQIDLGQIARSPVGTKLLRGHMDEVKAQVVAVVMKMIQNQAKKADRIITRDNAISQLKH